MAWVDVGVSVPFCALSFVPQRAITFLGDRCEQIRCTSTWPTLTLPTCVLTLLSGQCWASCINCRDTDDGLSRSRLCEKLYLKAESQQVDRILAAFSQRYWKLNPNCVYGSFGRWLSDSIALSLLSRLMLVRVDAVYAISYAILLLNTDLHVADITKHMSRSEFIENTLSTITTGPTPSPAISSSRSSGKLSLYSVFGGDATSDRPTSHWSSVQSLALKATNGSSSNIATTRNSDVESDPLRPSEAVLVTALKVSQYSHFTCERPGLIAQIGIGHLQRHQSTACRASQGLQSESL